MPTADSLSTLAERLSLIYPAPLAEKLTARLAPYVTVQLPASLLQTVLRLFEAAETPPEETVLLAGTLLSVMTHRPALHPDEVRLAALVTADARVLTAAPDPHPQLTAQRWFMLETLLRRVGLTEQAHEGLFTAGWAQHLTELTASSDETTAEFASAAGRFFYRQSAFKALTARLKRQKRCPAFRMSPAANPVFDGKAVLLPKNDVLITPASGETWLFLSAWGETLQRYFAPQAAILRCRSAQTAPEGRLTAAFPLLGNTVRLPDVLTPSALTAFKNAFDTVNQTVKANAALRRFYAVTEKDNLVGGFVPQEVIALAAPLWTDFFAALEIIADVASDHPTSAGDKVPHAVKRTPPPPDGRPRVPGFLFVFSEDDVPSRRHAQRLRLEEAFLTEENERSLRPARLTDRRHFPKSLAAPAFTPEALAVLSGVFSPEEIALLSRLSRFQLAEVVVTGYRKREKRL